MSFLLDFGVIAAFLLLFFPPLFTWAFNFHERILRILTIVAPGGAILLMFLMQSAAYVFIIYLGVFYFVLWYSRRSVGLPFALAFALAVYVPFSISVLWEFPIQIGIPQNPQALILSSFKALGILFFFVTVRRLGWRALPSFINAVSFTALIGVLMGLVFALQYATYPRIDDKVQFTPALIILAHLYRVPWFFLLLSVINDLKVLDWRQITPVIEDLNKE